MKNILLVASDEITGEIVHKCVVKSCCVNCVLAEARDYLGDDCNLVAVDLNPEIVVD